MGTLVTAWLHSESRPEDRFHARLRTVYQKVGLPSTIEELVRLDITSDIVADAQARIPRRSLLGKLDRHAFLTALERAYSGTPDT